jgi:hypothetical protein
VLTIGAEGGTHKPCCFTQLFGPFLILLSISTVSRVTLFTQLAPFALFCDLDVTRDFSRPILMTDVNARDGKIRTRDLLQLTLKAATGARAVGELAVW